MVTINNRMASKQISTASRFSLLMKRLRMGFFGGIKGMIDATQ